MVNDVTAEVRSNLGCELNEALAALAALPKYFKSATLSAAIGDVSEELVARHTKAKRKKRGSAYDLIGPKEERIEAKSRFQAPDRGRGPESLQFNFKQSKKSAQVAFCLYWVADEGAPPRLEQVFRVSVDELIRRWRQSKTSKYCARTTLKKLRDAAQESKGLPSTKRR
ncbi:MAG: hypothetical protein EXQ92_08300 [Alphaproteobacteria bacterium]|nr:hypothetical protein [Alphaproteobacteria bacterium]